MAGAFDLHGGISVQIPCNVHPYEDAAIQHWGAIWCLTPQHYEPAALWLAFWALNGDGSEVRRVAFEQVYGLTVKTVYDPVTGGDIEVYEATNGDFWEWYCDWFYSGGGDCSGLGYPVWP